MEQLAQLLDGELTREQADRPLRDLATLAATLTETEQLERPTPAARAALRNQLVAEIHASSLGAVDRVRDAVWARTARWRHSARVAMASALASGLLGSAGVAAAAQQALPGEALYGIKRSTESLRLALTDDSAEQGRLRLFLAERRLAEIRDGAHALDDDEIVDTLERMDEASVAGADALLDGVAAGGDRRLLDEIDGFTDRQRDGLVGLSRDLPAVTQPFVDTSLAVLRRIDGRVAAARRQCPVCHDDAAAAATGLGTRGTGCDCEHPASPPPARDPGLAPSAPVEAGDGESSPAGTPGAEASPRDVGTVVPPLPDELIDEVGDGLGDVGDSVEEGLDEVDDTLGRAPSSPEPSDLSGLLPELPDVPEVLEGPTLP